MDLDSVEDINPDSPWEEEEEEENEEDYEKASEKASDPDSDQGSDKESEKISEEDSEKISDDTSEKESIKDSKKDEEKVNENISERISEKNSEKENGKDSGQKLEEKRDEQTEKMKEDLKKAELAVQMMKQKLHDELLNISEERVENIMKNSPGAKEYFEGFKKKDKINVQTINEYKKQLDYTRLELKKWKDKVQDLERQAGRYYDEWKKTLAMNVQMEIELKALKETSPMEYSIPPPPPVDMQISDILRCVSKPNSYHSNMDFEQDIPPPPEPEPHESMRRLKQLCSEPKRTDSKFE